MTTIPPTPPSVPRLGLDLRPYTNITPFTVRDNATYLHTLESMRRWIEDVLTDHIDAEVAGLAKAWIDNMQKIDERVITDEALTAQTQSVLKSIAEHDTAVASRLAANLNSVNTLIDGIDTNINTQLSAAATAQAAVVTQRLAQYDTSLAERFAANASEVTNAINSGIDIESRVNASLTSETSPVGVTLRENYATATDAATARTVRLLQRPARDVHILMPGDSTHLQTKPWTRSLGTLIGARFPAFSVVYHKWNNTSGTYEDESLRNGTGTFTVHLWNLAFSGRTWSYYVTGAQWNTGVLGIPGADLIIASQGFNEVSTPALFEARYLAGIETIRTVYPKAEVILVAENAAAAPVAAATIAAHSLRADSVRNIAAQRGFGVIDAHDLFVRNANYASQWLQADGIHPNDTGMDAIAALAFSHFQIARNASPKSIQPAAFTVASDNLLPDGLLDGWDGAGDPPGASPVVGAGIVTRDTTLWETSGYSIKIVANTGNVYMPFDVPIDQLPKLRNTWITVSARVYTPVGSSAGVGRVGVDVNGDGTNITQSNGVAGEGHGGWRWMTISRFIPENAARVRIRVYATVGSDASGTVYLDRISAVSGSVPREAGARRSVQQEITTPVTGFGFPATVDPRLLRGSDQNTLPANRAVFIRVKDGGAISGIGLHVGQVSGNISVGAYRNSGQGRSAVPGAPIAVSASVACPNGYAEISFGKTVVVNPGDWLALSVDNNVAAFKSLLSGVLTSGLAAGVTYIRDNAFPLPNSVPNSLFASLGPNICLVGV